METIKRTTVTFTDGERHDILNADWGCYSTLNDKRAGRAILEVLTNYGINDNARKTVEQITTIADEYGAGELSDTSARDILYWFLDNVLNGEFRVTPQSYDKDEEYA
jgi:hypothetical protein